MRTFTGGVSDAGQQPWSGAVRVRRLAQGHLDTLGGAGDRTSNLPVTSHMPPHVNLIQFVHDYVV